ncbi:alpha/beta hydrolase [Planctomycetota bacterium]
MRSKRVNVHIVYGSLLAIVLLSGCAHNKDVGLIVTPVVYTHTDIDPFDHTPVDLQTTEVEVFYATNRKRKGSMNKPVYTNGMDHVLHLGLCTVQFGDSSLTWKQLHAASLVAEREQVIPVTVASSTEYGVLNTNVTSKPLKHPLAETHTIGDATFVAAINDRLRKASNKVINIYMHGYKVPFTHAPELASQLHHFANRQGVMVGFDWACRQKDITYFSDERRARRSAKGLVEFMSFLALNTDAKRINIISWSAGAPILSRALRELRNRYPELDHQGLVTKLKLHTAIFAASDVDFRQFVGDLKHFSDLPERLIITVCYEDPQLKLSRRVHGGHSRLGSLNFTELVEPEKASLKENLHRIEFVYISYDQGAIKKTNTATGHHYFFRNPWVLTDVLASMYLDLPASKRGLQQIEGYSSVWYFPDDYPQRSAASIYKIDNQRDMK